MNNQERPYLFLAVLVLVLAILTLLLSMKVG